MLAEAGYEGLQMRLLAERAGVAPMTLYNRFGNKDDLILLALQDILDSVGQRQRERSEVGVARIVSDSGIMADQILATPRYAQAMARMLFTAQPKSPIVQTLLVSNVAQARAQIAEMQRLGELGCEIDASLLSRALGVSGWSSILLWMQGLLPDREFGKHHVRSALLVLAPAMTPDTLARFASLLS